MTTSTWWRRKLGSGHFGVYTRGTSKVPVSVSLFLAHPAQRHRPIGLVAAVLTIALFGRPPIIHLRDCDVTEPIIVDDEDLSPDGIKERGKENNSRMCAFVAAIRLHVILEVCRSHDCVLSIVHGVEVQHAS